MKPASRNRTLLAELKKARERIPATPPAEETAKPDPPDLSGAMGVGATSNAADGLTAAQAATGPATGAESEAESPAQAWPSALAAQTGADRWERGALLAALAASLPPDFPTIRFGQEEICARGVYRTVSRSRGGTVVQLIFPGGTREFTPARESAAYRRWLDHLSRHTPADVHRAASRLCCTELVKHLESFEDHQHEAWTKEIDPAAWVRAE